MLKPCVGIMYCRSSLERALRIVVLPALSRPRTHMRTFFVGTAFFEEKKLERKPPASILNMIIVY